MIKGNQNFEGVGVNPHDFTVMTTGNTSVVDIGSSVLGGGNVLSTGIHPSSVLYDQNNRNREIILLLQVQFPDTYKQIMDALRARDALVNSQW